MVAKTDIRKVLGEQIREFRLAKGLSPKEFGDDIGKNQYYVLQLEDGQVDVDVVTLEKCAETLDLEIAELFFAAEIGGIPLLLTEEDETDRSH